MERRPDIWIGALGVTAIAYDMMGTYNIVSSIPSLDAALPVAAAPYLCGPVLSILLIAPHIKVPWGPRGLIALNTFASGVLVFLGTLLTLYRDGLFSVEASHMSTAVLLFFIFSFMASGLLALGMHSSLRARDHASKPPFMCGCFPFKRHEVEESHPAHSATVLSEMLVLQGLSPREVAAVAGIYGGSSSFQIAEDLGVKPPTVRTYLQRAYKKLGISSAEELQKAIANLVPTIECAGQREDEGLNARGWERARVAVRYRRLAWAHGSFAVSLLLSLLVPCGENAIPLPTCAMSAFLLGSAAIAVGMRFQHRLSIISIAVCSGALVAYVVARSSEVLWAPHLGSNWPCAALLLFACLCTISRWLSAVDRVSARGPEKTVDFFVRAAMLLIVPLLWILSNVTPMWWMLTVLLEMVVLGALEYHLIASRSVVDCSVVSCRSMNEGGARRYDFSIPHAVFAACGVVLGFLWIDLLFPGAVYPFSEYEVPIVVPLVLSAVLAIAAKENHGLQWLVPASAFFSLIVLWFVPLVSGWMTAGSTATALAVHMALLAIQLDSCFRRRACTSLATGVTFGLCMGYYLVAFNRATSEAALLGLFPAHGAVELTFRTFLFGGLSFGASVALLYFAYCSIHDGHRDVSPETFDAIHAYLYGRGLSQLQTEVVILIMMGSTGPSIAQALSYSLGSVNHARREAYRLLGVHDARSLKELIKRDVPAAQDL